MLYTIQFLYNQLFFLYNQMLGLGKKQTKDPNINI